MSYSEWMWWAFSEVLSPTILVIFALFVLGMLCGMLLRFLWNALIKAFLEKKR